MWKCPQGVHDFLRAYYTTRALTGRTTNPFRLKSWSARRAGEMPTYYIMDLDRGWRRPCAGDASSPEIAANKWLPDEELSCTARVRRNGFQGGLRGMVHDRQQVHPSCRLSPAHDRRAVDVIAGSTTGAATRCLARWRHAEQRVHANAGLSSARAAATGCSRNNRKR